MRTRLVWWSALIEAVFILPAARVLLWTVGYGRTMQVLRPPRRAESSIATGVVAVPDAVVVVASAVSTLARLGPFRSRCLARSITIRRMAGRRGHAVSVVMGVAQPQSGRLPAHAWVEYRGVPVNDTPDVRARYVVLPMPTALDDR